MSPILLVFKFPRSGLVQHLIMPLESVIYLYMLFQCPSDNISIFHDPTPATDIWSRKTDP